MRGLFIVLCVLATFMASPAIAEEYVTNSRDVARLDALTDIMSECTYYFDDTTPTQEEYLFQTGHVLRYTIVGFDGEEYSVDRDEYRRFVVAQCMVKGMQENSLFEIVEQQEI